MMNGAPLLCCCIHVLLWKCGDVSGVLSMQEVCRNRWEPLRGEMQESGSGRFDSIPETDVQEKESGGEWFSASLSVL